jgi:hypothetical protein
VQGGFGEAAAGPFHRASEDVAQSEHFMASEEAREMKHSDVEREIEARAPSARPPLKRLK